MVIGSPGLHGISHHHDNSAPCIDKSWPGVLNASNEIMQTDPTRGKLLWGAGGGGSLAEGGGKVPQLGAQVRQGEGIRLEAFLRAAV